jgi:glucose/arabinose dehydrogenase
VALSLVVVFAIVVATPCAAQQNGSSNYGKTMAFDTYTPGPCSPNGQPHGGCPPGTLHRIRVVPVAIGLDRPWHIAFLPGDRGILVTESPGRLRIVRNGVLDPKPVPGWPVAALHARTLNSVLVHPQFEQNHFVYLSYSKGSDAKGTASTGPAAASAGAAGTREGAVAKDEPKLTTLALARGRLEGGALTDVQDIFVADAWEPGGALAGRAAFGPDGMVYLAVGDRDLHVTTDDNSSRMAAQHLDNDAGKVLRLRDDGSIPADNPFVHQAGAKPEIFTYGHRNVYGFAWHPETGALWSCEIGPMGGDELNILVAGKNYGWPLVSFGRIYSGNVASEQSYYRPGMEMPVMFWVPAISPSSLIFYTGDRFPFWKGHLFIGALNGQQVLRVAFNQPPPQEERRESLLTQMDVRVRDVRQGPDGYIYVATETAEDTTGLPNPRPDRKPRPDGPHGMVLRIEPAE